MKSYTTNRTLYFGGRDKAEAGQTVELNENEVHALLESGAIVEGKAAPNPANKMNPAPANKDKCAPKNKAG